jgi:FKBP-type peptidyl-prolyl cis-trans isomerase SlyD
MPISPSLPIISGHFVELSFTAYDEDGEVVEIAKADDPLGYVHGYGQIPPGLERALDGLTPGQVRDITLEPADGYGDHDPDGVFEVERTDFPNPAAVKIDDEFVAEGPDGSHVPMRVIDVRDDSVVVDTNHPLAGHKIRFDVKVETVRPATEQEIAEAEAEMEHDHDHEGCTDESHDHGHSHGDPSLVQLGIGPKKPGPPS